MFKRAARPLGAKLARRAINTATIIAKIMIYEALGVTGFQFSHVIFAGIFDGLLSGFGAGLVIISEGTFGGSILLSRILEEQWNFKIDKVLFMVDVVVLSVSLLTLLSLPN